MTENKRRIISGRSLFSAGGLVLVLLILVFINVVFSEVNLRWDATEENLYSLSSGTRDILSKLEDEVTIKVFYTKGNVNTPLYIKTYAKRMMDFLSEYERYSDGMVKVEAYNPEPDSVEEEWAQKYGMRSVNLPTGEKLYFGLVAVSGDQEEAIPMIDPAREEHLEYDITRLISRVRSPEKKKIGIISSLPVFGQPQQQFNMQQAPQEQTPWVFIEELKKNYQVDEIPMTSETIDEEYDLLMLIHPKQMSDSLQYAVDQHVMKGKNAIVFVDSFCVSDQSQGMAKFSHPEKLLKSWGVNMDPRNVVADYNLTTKLRNPSNQIEENPMWLSVSSENMNDETIVTSQLESLLLPMAGSLTRDPKSEFEYETLVESSKNSSLINSMMLRYPLQRIRRDFKATVDTYDLAVKVRGEFASAFPDGKPKKKADEEEVTDLSETEEGNHLAKAEKKSTLIIVSDSDMLNDPYYVSRQNFLGMNLARIFNDNLNLLLNSTEVLTGSEALIDIRTRGKFERPFVKVEELEKKAKKKLLDREQELVQKMEETNRKLQEFESQKDASQRFIVSAEQEKEIKKFQEEKSRINKELRLVRRTMRKDIEALGNKLKFINILLMPLIVVIAGLGFAFYRRKKSRRSE